MFAQLTPTTSLAYLIIVFAIRMIGIGMIMMPATTAGLNVLPKKLIPHGTAMTNTMRQVAASVGTAILITIMTVTALEPGPGIDENEALVHGVNVSFYVVMVISILTLILSFYLNEKNPQISDESVEIRQN